MQTEVIEGIVEATAERFAWVCIANSRVGAMTSTETGGFLDFLVLEGMRERICCNAGTPNATVFPDLLIPFC